VKKILISVMTVAVVAGLIGGGAFAYFNDTETSTGNTFSAGTLDLKVNGGDDPLLVLVELKDMKPCEWKYIEIKLHVGENDADGWIMFDNVVSAEGVDTEPELLDPDNPTKKIADYITVDVKIGDTVIIAPAEHKKLGDLEDDPIKLGKLTGCVDYTLTLSFHLQEEVTNWAQGDVATFDIVFGADQVKP